MTDGMIGRTVSHYRILAALGRGGMGEVYRALDLDLQRTVALKFLPEATKAYHRAQERFIQEARAASSLDHPHIGVVHEVGATATGQAFIVMACYEGGSLQERIAANGLTTAAAVDIVCQITGGLEAAHRRGIVHRDVKPANILFDGEDRVKVVDFGLAKLADATQLTQAGQAVGTAAYMSPEQAQGLEVDPRSDVFSCGTMLYEMLTGRLPFTGDSSAALLYQIVHGDPTPLSAGDSQVQRLLARIVKKALAKSPDQRYQSMADMRQDLLACRELSRDPGSTAPQMVARGLRPRSRRWAWLALGLTGLATVMAVSVWLWLRSGRDLAPAGDPSLAVLQFQDLVEADTGQLTMGLMGLLNVGLIENCPVRVVSTEYLHDLKRRLFGAEQGDIATDQALTVAREAGATLLLTGQVGRLGDLTYVTWRLVDAVSGANLAADRLEAGDLLSLADATIADVLPAVSRRLSLTPPVAPAPVSQLTTRSADAYRHYQVGLQALAGFRREEAERELSLATRLDSTFALPHLALSQLHYYGVRSRAQEHWSRAWQLRENLGVQDRLRLEVMQERLQRPNNFRVIVQLYRDMLERWPDSRWILSDLSEVLVVNLNDYAGALVVARQGLDLYPDDLTFGMRVASGLRNTGRRQEALAAAHRFNRQHTYEPNAWDELGTAYLAVAKLDSATFAYERALTLDPSFWFANLNLAATAFCRGDDPAAIAKVEAIVAQLDQPPNSRLIIHNSNVMGLAFYYREMGQGGRARTLFEAARQHGTWAGLEQAFDRLLLSLHAAQLVVERSAELADQYPDLDPTVQAAQEGLAWVALDSLSRARSALAVADESYQRLGSGRFERDRLAIGIALAEGNATQALDLIERLWAYGLHFPGPNDIVLRDLHAQALHLAGRSTEAVAVLDETLLLYAGHHEARYLRGMILAETGWRERARQDLERFLAAWQDSDLDWPQLVDAQRRLAMLR